MKKVAHFLLIPELADSPPNEALISAYTELGYAVDVYSPGRIADVSQYADSVSSLSVEYGYRWILKSILSQTWFRYSIFSGTTEDPIAVAGLLSRLYRRPLITLADEIKSGSFGGNRNPRWKSLCRWGMRRSALTVVNDQSRINLQREYVGLPDDAEIVVYPGCFREPPVGGDKYSLRSDRDIPAEAVVLAYSGVLNIGNGGLWLGKLLAERKDVHVLGQIIQDDELVIGLLRNIQGAERLYLESKRVSWKAAWSNIKAADIGIVVYLQDGPQFQHMGISSNRLCMFLAMGVPVIATRQPSFEFIEEYDCGVLVNSEEEFISAIDQISPRLEQMEKNALRCAREYIDAPSRYEGLKQSIKKTTA